MLKKASKARYINIKSEQVKLNLNWMIWIKIKSWKEKSKLCVDDRFGVTACSFVRYIQSWMCSYYHWDYLIQREISQLHLRHFRLV